MSVAGRSASGFAEAPAALMRSQLAYSQHSLSVEALSEDPSAADYEGRKNVRALIEMISCQ